MNFYNSKTIESSPDSVWSILASDYNHISDWASAVPHSAQDPDLPEGEGRIFHTRRLGEVREPIRHFDTEKRTFTFEVISDGFPFFVKSVYSTWTVQPPDANRSEVSINMRYEMLPVFGALMSPLFKNTNLTTTTIDPMYCPILY